MITLSLAPHRQPSNDIPLNGIFSDVVFLKSSGSICDRLGCQIFVKCLECRYLFSGFDHAENAGDREIEQYVITFCTEAISLKTAKEAKKDRDTVKGCDVVAVQGSRARTTTKDENDYRGVASLFLLI